MANPAKAQLTSGQGAAAIIAGVIGHFLFSIAWAGLLISLGFLLFRGLITGLIDQFLGGALLEGDAGSTIRQVFETIQGFITGLSIAFVVIAAVGILFAFFISWLILKIGKVRKPGGATFSSFLIVALLDGGLFLLALTIGSSLARNTDNGSPFIIVWVVITAVVGALVWLWMVWVRRGPATDPAVVVAPDGTAVTPAADAPVLDAGAKPAASAPAVDPVAPAAVAALPPRPAVAGPPLIDDGTSAAPATKAPAKSSTASKTPAKKPPAKKPPATKPPAGTTTPEHGRSRSRPSLRACRPNRVSHR